MKKPLYETGNVGLRFVDKTAVANKDTTVLPEMVNAQISKNSPDKRAAEESREAYQEESEI